jgi:hypothetical protein
MKAPIAQAAAEAASEPPCDFFFWVFFLEIFWYFLLTIQNTASRQVRNLCHLVAVFISFPLARCCCCCGSCGCLLLRQRAPTPPRPPFGGGEKYQKKENRL